MIKTFQQLRDFIREARQDELDLLIEQEDNLYEKFYRAQGYIQALWDIDQLLRSSIKFQDDVE